MSTEKKQFKTESKRLLDMMVNSIYTHREIFLREIISNASDAIDKLCYQSLTDDKVGMNREDFEIRLVTDEKERTLTVSDNGIGMGVEELENNLGVIASSGSYRFRQEVDAEADVDIIGQFGVGFYSAFMVADRITVITRKYGSEEALCWQSSGADGYTITPAKRACPGTDVIMHLKADTEEEKYSEFLDQQRLYGLVKKYSDYIRWPIRMVMSQSRVKEGSDPQKPEYESYLDDVTINSMVPLWQRKKSEVTQEEYNKFYQDKFGEFAPPQSVIAVSAEGLVSYKALLFIPGENLNVLMNPEVDSGLQLYSAGVMIMENCKDLLPEYLGFVRGVVESPDLSLNISRELLQHDRQLKIIATNLEKKVRGELERMLREDRAGYEVFYKNFCRRLKFGVMDNFGARKEQLQDLLLFYSSKEKKLVTLKEYVSRMQEGQTRIYYAIGSDMETLEQLPQAELVREKDMEILYLTDKADSFLFDMLQKYDDKPFCSVTDGDLGLEEEAGSDAEATLYQPCFDFCKEALGDMVDEVRLSRKLRSHPVSLTSGEGVTFEMEKYFASVQPEAGIKAKRILELNVEHPAFQALEKARVENPEKAKQYARILLEQAKLIAGLPIENPVAYTDLVCGLMN